MNLFFVERPLLGTAGNLVLLSEKVAVRQTATTAIEAVADMMQGRFGWTPFILGLDTALDMGCPGIFELAQESGVFGMPFESFTALPSPIALLTNFHVFDSMWDLLYAGGDGELETVLLDFHQDHGLILGWWQLPSAEVLFYT